MKILNWILTFTVVTTMIACGKKDDAGNGNKNFVVQDPPEQTVEAVDLEDMDAALLELHNGEIRYHFYKTMMEEPGISEDLAQESAHERTTNGQTVAKRVAGFDAAFLAHCDADALASIRGSFWKYRVSSMYIGYLWSLAYFHWMKGEQDAKMEKKALADKIADVAQQERATLKALIVTHCQAAE